MNENQESKGVLGWLRHNFHFTKLLKPMIYSLLFAGIYNLGYIFLQAQNWGLWTQALEVLWLSVYGLSWYFVSTLAWGRKQAVLSSYTVSVVFLWFLAWNVLATYILAPMYSWAVVAQASSLVLIAIQLLSAVQLIVMIPASILLFRCLYEGQSRLHLIFASMFQSMRQHASPVFNSWLLLFLLLAVWDTLFSGPLSLYYGFNATVLVMQLLFLGNPLGFGMLLISYIAGGVSGGYMYAAVLALLSGLIMNWLEINLIVYIGQYFEKDVSYINRQFRL